MGSEDRCISPGIDELGAHRRRICDRKSELFRLGPLLAGCTQLVSSVAKYYATLCVVLTLSLLGPTTRTETGTRKRSLRRSSSAVLKQLTPSRSASRRSGGTLHPTPSQHESIQTRPRRPTRTSRHLTTTLILRTLRLRSPITTTTNMEESTRQARAAKRGSLSLRYIHQRRGARNRRCRST